MAQTACLLACLYTDITQRLFVIATVNCQVNQLIEMDLNHFLRDLVCGTVSGAGNCVSGYIFDTLKVRMQMDHSLTMVASLKSIIKTEGFMHLFNGMYYPFITVPVINSIVFASYQLFKKITNKKELSLLNGIENGAFAGLVNTLVVSPVQLVKCHMQLDSTFQYKNSSQCARAIVKKEGIKGLFRGSISTAFREVFAYGAQFAVYQFLKQKIVSKEKPSLSILEGLFIGTCAGICCWIFSYPQDIIKTMIQVSQPDKYKRSKWGLDGGVIDCAKVIYGKDGLKGFWIGIEPCLVRAAIANAIGIALYEQTQLYFSQLRRVQDQ